MYNIGLLFFSWIDGRDRTVKFWDTRAPTPAAVVNLCERAYAMDTRGAMMVVATADRKVRRFFGCCCSFWSVERNYNSQMGLVSRFCEFEATQERNDTKTADQKINRKYWVYGQHVLSPLGVSWPCWKGQTDGRVLPHGPHDCCLTQFL